MAWSLCPGTLSIIREFQRWVILSSWVIDAIDPFRIVMKTRQSRPKSSMCVGLVPGRRASPWPIRCGWGRRAEARPTGAPTRHIHHFEGHRMGGGIVSGSRCFSRGIRRGRMGIFDKSTSGRNGDAVEPFHDTEIDRITDQVTSCETNPTSALEPGANRACGVGRWVRSSLRNEPNRRIPKREFPWKRWEWPSSGRGETKPTWSRESDRIGLGRRALGLSTRRNEAIVDHERTLFARNQPNGIAHQNERRSPVGFTESRNDNRPERVETRSGRKGWLRGEWRSHDHVPISQLARYLVCSAVRVSMEMPIVWSLRLATHWSTALGTS